MEYNRYTTPDPSLLLSEYDNKSNTIHKNTYANNKLVFIVLIIMVIAIGYDFLFE